MIMKKRSKFSFYYLCSPAKVLGKRQQKPETILMCVGIVSQLASAEKEWSTTQHTHTFPVVRARVKGK
jgi:hypothetical protein